MRTCRRWRSGRPGAPGAGEVFRPSRDLAREEEHIAEAEGQLRRIEHETRRLTEAGSRDHEEPQLRQTAAAAGLAGAKRSMSDAGEGFFDRMEAIRRDRRRL